MEKISGLLEELYKELDKALSTPDTSFSFTKGKLTIELDYPTSREEYKAWLLRKKSANRELLRDALKRELKNIENFAHMDIDEAWEKREESSDLIYLVFEAALGDKKRFKNTLVPREWDSDEAPQKPKDESANLA